MAEWSISLSELRRVLDCLEPVRSGDLSVRFRLEDGKVVPGSVTGLQVATDKNGEWDVTLEVEQEVVY